MKTTTVKKSVNVEKYKDYTYTQIENFAQEQDYRFEEIEFGNTMGKSFIVLEHNDKDLTLSFVLTGWVNMGNIYTCIYSDL